VEGAARCELIVEQVRPTPAAGCLTGPHVPLGSAP
jgi:hypothetical protein